MRFLESMSTKTTVIVGCMATVAALPHMVWPLARHVPLTRLWAAGAQRSAGTTRALYTT